MAGLTGDITAAHLHVGEYGINGGPVRTLTSEFDHTTLDAVWTAGDAESLSAAQREALMNGKLYFNVHTAANAAGEIRGQVFASGGLGSAGQLDPGQEPNGATGDGSGTMSTTLTSQGLSLDMTVSNLTGAATAAHIHNAPQGENGGVARTVHTSFDGNSLSLLWQASDGEALTPLLNREIIAGRTYVNVHTAANGGGEIRGQIAPGLVIQTGIEAAVTPKGFATLGQNYPNPFAGSTTIPFSVAESGPVRIDVVDLLGRVVTQLVDATLPEGDYEVTFEPLVELPSGVYLYRIESNRQLSTRRMTVVR